MERKDFIRSCGVLCMGGVAVSALLQSCGTQNYYAKTTLNNNELVIKKSEFIKTEKEKTTQRNYVLVKSDKYPFPVYVHRISENEYSAVLMQCTHKGCELKPQGSFLMCPCHGSEFSNQGVVQNPPAEENLKTFTTKTDNENIYIQL